MKYFIRYSILPILAILAMGCSRDTAEPQALVPDSDNDISLKININTPESAPSRASTLVADNQVSHLDILVFEVVDGDEVFSYLAQTISITHTSQENIKEVSSRLSFTDRRQRLVLFANAQAEVAAALSSPSAVGTEKSELLESLLFRNKNVWTNESLDFVPIPMWGESELISVNTYSSIDLDVTLLRMAARVDVLIADELASMLTIESMSIYNAKSRGRIMPDEAAFGSLAHKVVSPTVPADNNSGDPLVLAQPLVYNAEDGVLPSGYIFESEASSAGAEADALCVVIGAKYGSDTDPTYYRADFVKRTGNTTQYQPVLRNYRYVFNITELSGRGYPTPEEAMAAILPDNMTVTLYKWDKGTINFFVFNSFNMLGVSTDEITLDSSFGALKTINVTTDYTGGWKANIIQEGSWITYLGGNFTQPEAIDTYRITMMANNTGIEKVGYVEFTAGPLSLKVKITHPAI